MDRWREATPVGTHSGNVSLARGEPRGDPTGAKIVGSYIARRLMLMVVAAVGVTLISFVISHAVPSDPVVANLGQQASQRPEIVAAYKARWGLDKPLHEQYLTFLANLSHGELGTSLTTRRPISADVAQFLPATIELSLTAIVIAL